MNTPPASLENLLAANPAVECSLTRHGPMLHFARDVYIGTSLREYGEFSQHEIAFLTQLVGPGDTVVEAGANIGALTVPLARVLGPGGAIHAIEPQRPVFQLLCANAVLGGLTNVHARHAAIGTGRAPLYLPALDYGAPHNFGGVSPTPDATGERVECIAIDDLDLPACHLIKADVEGMEFEVLASAVRTIARHRPLLYVENDRQDRSPALISFIESLGYRPWWHLPYLYNADNFLGKTENRFETIVSVNMICVPVERKLHFVGVQPVNGPADYPPMGR